MWCLTKEYASKFLSALKEGKINPDKLINMTSDNRRVYLGQFVGEFNAKYANTLFESKLLLKNQQRGMITWAKKFSGLKKETENDIVAKINKLSKALNPEEGKQFLADIVEKRLGVSLNETEAKTITNLTKKMEDLYNPAKESFLQSKEYFQEKQKLLKFIRDASPNILALTKKGKILKGTEIVLSVLRALKTGFDLSLSLRQGITYFGRKEWRSGFIRMFRYAKDPLAMDELEVRMLSHRYSSEALKYKKELGLTIFGEKFTQREEQFGAKVISKIPLLRGSERAFVGFANDLRFNRFVNVLSKLEKAGNGITDNPEAMKSLAQTIAAGTGRGGLGKAETMAGPLSTVLFSPRWLTSRFQVLINPFTKKGPARIEAIQQLATVMGVAVSILGMVKLAGGDVELDTRSADFGKAKIGNTRFDLTGGLAPVITLLSRMGTLSTKSSTTGVVSMLNSKGFGVKDALDVAIEFITNKASPIGGVVRDVLKGEDFEGGSVELGFSKDFAMYLADQLVYPLISTDAYDAFTDGSGGVWLGGAATFASLFGLGVQTYAPSIKQQIREIYQDGDTDEANRLLKSAVEEKKISEQMKKDIIRDADLPNDVIYFRDLTTKDQEKLLKNMDINDLQRFAWYANKDIIGRVSTLSDDAKEFINGVKEGKFKKPQWEKGKIK